MARHASFKGGGGFLNEVDAKILDYDFTDEFNGEPFKPGKMKDWKTGKPVDKPHSLFCAVRFRVDGAEADVTKEFKVANDFEGWEITDDGKTLAGVDEGRKISKGCAFAKFIESIEAAGEGVAGYTGAESEDYPEFTYNFEPIINLRVRLVQRVDSERTQKFGKQKAKDGKEYDRKDLVVENVYGYDEVEAKPTARKGAPAKSAKTATNGSGKKLTNGSGKAAPAASADDALAAVEALATETLQAIVAERGGSITKAKLNVPILKRLAKDPLRQDVYKLLSDDDGLAAIVESLGGTYDTQSQEIRIEA